MLKYIIYGLDEEGKKNEGAHVFNQNSENSKCGPAW